MYNDPFHSIDKDQFLTHYWQKKPCVFRNALASPPSFLTADELAGFSLDEEVESRLIRFNTENNQWSLEHGPFEVDRFNDLPESNWTLLVQSIDNWSGETRQLLEYFSFIPRWRFDDIMVSYATEQGGVGPHFDNYDVFLVQGEGRRHWRVGAKGKLSQQTQIIDGLSHLQDFEAIIDTILEPGDILYVPPETAHWGVSVGESIGYSVGYRTPQAHQLTSLLTEFISENLSSSDFFTDQYRNNSLHNNEFEPELTQWAQNELIKLSQRPDLLTKLLSKQLSLSKLGIFSEANLHSIQQLNENSVIQLVPEVNINWWQNDSNIFVNIEGESFIFEKYLIIAIEKLANFQPCHVNLFKKQSNMIDFPEELANLINRGYVNLID